MAILSSDFIAELNAKVINPAFEVARTNYNGVLSRVGYGAARQPEGGY